MTSKWRQFWCDLGFHSWGERTIRVIRGHLYQDSAREVTRVCRCCGRRQRWYE